MRIPEDISAAEAAPTLCAGMSERSHAGVPLLT